MRLSPAPIANALAWFVLGGLVLLAILVANRLGFAGLCLLGGLTWLICTSATLDQKVPSWGVGVFRAAMDRPRSAEERAAHAAEHEAAVSPLRFYGRCGAVLAVIGALGFAWQLWRGEPPP